MKRYEHIFAPTRRRDVLGVHSLDRLVFSVPDLMIAKEFFDCFGLDVNPRGNALDIGAFGHAHRWISIVEGYSKRLAYLSYGIFQDDLPAFIRRIEALNCVRIAPPAGTESDGIWLLDPDGIPVEIRVAEKSSPSAKPSGGLVNVALRDRAGGADARVARTRPTRFSHLLLFSRDVPAQVAWCRQVLGLRLSDRSGNEIAFLHGVHGSDHHMLAFVRSSGPGIHHTSWDVSSIHEVGIGAMQMARHGFTRGWGLGRHVLGSNYFHYVRDPWSSYAEFSCDMDFIPHTQDWSAGDHVAANAFYMWGPTPPGDFIINYEIESLA